MKSMLQYQHTILVPSENGATVLFPVKLTHLGEIPIRVIAVSPTASDAITQKILVKVNIWSLKLINGNA
jgi:CD109 antigen